MLFHNHDLRFCFPHKGPDLSESPNAHLHFVTRIAVYDIPDQDIVVAAQI